MGRDRVHDDHVALVVRRELERAAVRMPVHGEEPVVRSERDPLDPIALQDRLPEIVVDALEERELERCHDERARPAVGDRLARLADERRAVRAGLARQRARGLARRELDAQRGHGADVRPREGLPDTAVEERPVGRDGRDGAGRGDHDIREPEAGDVHADGRGHRRERRRRRGPRAGENARHDDQRGAGQPHASPAYTSGFNTPMNGRLR